MPKDTLGQDIAFLLAKYPELSAQYNNPDLDRLPMAEKETMLADIHAKLGIQTIRTRHIGYCGD